jgi:hypothetical protein
MSIAIGSEMIIANGVVSPIRMTSFPSVETIHPEWVGDKPDIANSQIEILATNETDVFVAIPDVTVRNHYGLLYHRLRSHIGRFLSCARAGGKTTIDVIRKSERSRAASRISFESMPKD